MNIMDNKNEFKPYIPANKIVPEFTVTSVLIGIILAVVFGAANAYLGLLVGMTVSASIPAAVISMGIIRIILRRDSILENNLVQTIGSAGESLAAGAIFTLPALFLWAKEGKMAYPSILTIFLIALFGGILGVCFMVPLRQALIVEEHGTLPFPEGTACAEVLLAGEEGGSKAGAVFSGLGIAAFYKLVADGLKLFPSEIGYAFKSYAGSQIGIQVLPSLAGVGFICGPKISSYMLAGGALSWFVLMPAIALFGADATIYPGTETISAILADPEQGPGGLWTNYIKYIGAGAVAAGGVISLIKTFPLIVRTFKQAMSSMGKKHQNKSVLRTQQDLPMSVLLILIAAIVILIWLIPTFPVNPIGSLIIVIFGFFFASVSSRMVGLIGSSNNPVSGMAIATIIIATVLLKVTGTDGTTGMIGAIAIGGVICIIAVPAAPPSACVFQICVWSFFSSSMSYCIAKPYSAVSLTADMLQIEQCRVGFCAFNSVEHRCHSFSAVNARTHHNADFIKKSGFKECTVDMSSAYQGNAFYTEMYGCNIHRLVQVDSVFTCGNP